MPIGLRTGDRMASRAGVHASDQDIGLLAPSLIHEARHPRPSKAPEQINPRGEHRRFIQPNLTLAEWLPQTICAGDPVAVNEGDVKTVGVSQGDHGLVQMRQSGCDGASCSAATNDRKPDLLL